MYKQISSKGKWSSLFETVHKTSKSTEQPQGRKLKDPKLSINHEKHVLTKTRKKILTLPCYKGEKEKA